MKKNMKKILLSSVAALGFAAIGVSTTFALFTSNAETNINAKAGIVKINSDISIVSVEELNDQVVEATDGVYKNSVGGKTYIDSQSNALKLEKWVPGDKAVIEIKNVNASNVAIKTKFSVDVSQSDDTKPNLEEVLDLEYEVITPEGSPINQNNYTKWTLVEYSEDNPITDLSTVKITISFPDSDEGNFNPNSLDNAYQDGNVVYTFTQLAIQGNAYTRDGKEFHVTNDNSENYVIDENGQRTDLTATWGQIIGTGDQLGRAWQLNPVTGLYEKPGDVGMARDGDTVYMGPGEYYLGGKMYPSAGVTLIGSGREIGGNGTWIDAEMICLNGDLTLKDLVVLQHETGDSQHVLQANTVNLNSQTSPTRNDIMLSADYLLKMDNVAVQARDGYAQKLNAIAVGALQLDFNNCLFKDFTVALGSINITQNKVFSIKNTVFDHTGEAMGVASGMTLEMAQQLVDDNTGLNIYSDTLETPLGNLVSNNYGDYTKARNAYTYEDLCNVIRIY